MTPPSLTCARLVANHPIQCRSCARWQRHTPRTIRFDLARDTLADAAKLFPNRPQITILWMQFLVARGDFAGAINAADAAVRRDPKNTTLVTAKAGVEEKSKDFAAAETTLRNGASAQPRDIVLQMALAQLQGAREEERSGPREPRCGHAGPTQRDRATDCVFAAIDGDAPICRCRQTR